MTVTWKFIYILSIILLVLRIFCKCLVCSCGQTHQMGNGIMWFWDVNSLCKMKPPISTKITTTHFVLLDLNEPSSCLFLSSHRRTMCSALGTKILPALSDCECSGRSHLLAMQTEEAQLSMLNPHGWYMNEAFSVTTQLWHFWLSERWRGGHRGSKQIQLSGN